MLQLFARNRHCFCISFYYSFRNKKDFFLFPFTKTLQVHEIWALDNFDRYDVSGLLIFRPVCKSILKGVGIDQDKRECISFL